MSRLLGKKARMQRRRQSGEASMSTFEDFGRIMYETGQPCPPKSADKGKDHAKWRGWQRAATDARTKASKGSR